MSGAALALGPWRDCPRPSDAPDVVGSWKMAALAAEQSPAACRVLWEGEGEAAEVAALGGVLRLSDTDGMAFLWRRPDLPSTVWRIALPAVLRGLDQAHERGLRRIQALVAAGHAEGHRLIERLGFAFTGDATGYVGAEGALMAYARFRPSIEESALVAFQKRELRLAMLAEHCPAYHARLMRERRACT